MDGDRVITIAGIRSAARNVRGAYKLRVGVAIFNPEDQFEYHLCFDKALGRATAQDMRIDIASPEDAKKTLLYIGNKVVRRMKYGKRPFTKIESYNIPVQL
jgi:hypothetical protein